MKVYALVGRSGTGKSHHSMWVARENNIEYIIDDGLLVSDNQIIAGKSAKREPTKIASVRRAIFSDPKHQEEVKNAIAEYNIDSLLIIGTSVNMVDKIAEAIGVAPIEKYIKIEDVSTPEEMKIANEMRMKHGKHVIPVPTFEVKKQFSGYFIDPMVQFFTRKNDTIAEEKTVMRPTYSYLGDYKISPKAIYDICAYEASRFKSMYKLLKFKSRTTKGNRLILDIELSLRYPYNVAEEARKIADSIKTSIEEHTSINVKYVNIYVKALHVSRIYLKQKQLEQTESEKDDDIFKA
ncbi:MAG: hypothetical protein MRZ66_00900 [Clostridiales bacterium]|nr:hypothetical protein [Clostridiales bacterium]